MLSFLRRNRESAYALLSAVVRANAQVRTQEDLEHELHFLADNLDEDRDYTFMRP